MRPAIIRRSSWLAFRSGMLTLTSRQPSARCRLRSDAAASALCPLCTERLLISGFPALPESVALVQLAASSGVTSAACSMDAALHAKLCTAQTLTSAINLLPQRHRKRARTALLATDAACESVGESRTRLLLTDLGYPVRTKSVCWTGCGWVLGWTSWSKVS